MVDLVKLNKGETERFWELYRSGVSSWTALEMIMKERGKKKVASEKEKKRKEGKKK